MKSVRRSRLLVVAVSLLLAGGVAPAHAATTQSLDAESGPQLPLVDPAIQAAAEAEVARFVAAHPEPEFIMGSGAEAFDRFLAELLDYYPKVPWDATILQWGCTVTQPVNVAEGRDVRWGADRGVRGWLPLRRLRARNALGGCCPNEVVGAHGDRQRRR